MKDHELVANSLCLEFTNTVNSRYVVRWDRLDSAPSFLGWTRAVGIPVRDEVTVSFLEEARAYREVIHRVFSALAEGEEPPAPDIDQIHAAATAGQARATIVREGNRYARTWTADRTPPQALAEISVSALDLLTNGPLDRIGRCPECGWLFLDTSRNGRRRWCSMSVCGGRSKASRYYAAHRDR